VSKITPGPWTNRADIGVIFDSNGRAIQTGGDQCDEESQANAVLIAAAPDLYAAVNYLLIVLEDQKVELPFMIAMQVKKIMNMHSELEEALA